MSPSTTKSWSENLKTFIDIRNITMLLLGFSAGLPILLIFSSLSLWLREAGVSKGTVTFFSWAALGYSFKFVWAPLVDRLPLPFLTKILGRRRSWLLFSQILVTIAIAAMGLVDPTKSEQSLTFMALAAVMLGFSSATQDIVIDAYRIESAPQDMQAILSATYIGGYRIAMIVSGAGALFLAAKFGSSKEAYSYSAWRLTYLIMAACMGVGILTTLLRPEPKVESEKNKSSYTTTDYFRFLVLFLFICSAFIAVFFYSAPLVTSGKEALTQFLGNKAFASFLVGSLRLAVAVMASGTLALILTKVGVVNKGMVQESYVDPVLGFFHKYGTNVALLLLTLVGLYRVSDIVLGVISNVFYQDLGFSKTQIASVVKTFGLIMSLLGGFLGGLLTTRMGVIKMLWWGALLSAVTNVLFIVLAKTGANVPMLYLVISADNLAAGLASAAFVAFLSSLTDVSFTAVQYAIFSSLMTLIPKVLGGYSGSIVEVVGYETFFFITTLIGIPVLWIVTKCGKIFNIQES